MANRTIGVHGDVSGTTTNVYHAHTQIFFIFSQHRMATGQRLQNQIINVQTATVNAFLNVLHRSHRTRDDVYTRIQTHATHANGLFYTGLVVDDVFLYHGMQHIVVRWNVYGFGRFNRTIDVSLCHFAVFDFHHTL